MLKGRFFPSPPHFGINASPGQEHTVEKSKEAKSENSKKPASWVG